MSSPFFSRLFVCVCVLGVEIVDDYLFRVRHNTTV